MAEKINGTPFLEQRSSDGDNEIDHGGQEQEGKHIGDPDDLGVTKFDLLGPVGERLIEPTCISISNTGEYAVTDSESCFVVIYDNMGNYLSHFSTIPKKLFYIFLDIDSYKPNDVAWLSSKRVVYTQPKGCRVMISDWIGKCTVTIEGRPLYEPYGVAVDTGNNIFVTDRHKGRILCYSCDGKLIQTIGKFGASDCVLNYPHYIRISHNGDIYVNHCDKGKVSIAVYNRNGAIKKSLVTDLDIDKDSNIQQFTIDQSGNIFHVSSTKSSVSLVTDTHSEVMCTEEGSDPDSARDTPTRQIDMHCALGGITCSNNNNLVCINQTAVCVHMFSWRSHSKLNGFQSVT